jgi:bifunctional non-homologous end joining protein LigD
MAKGKLSEYSAKRSFSATPEPAAALPEARSGPLLFVIQQHSATRLHYDFRLECDGVLKSWAVPKGPSLDPADKRLAVPTEDHPFDYASFEGVIPPGQYGAGEVIVWDCGVYSPDEEEPWVEDREAAQRQLREGLEKGKLSVMLRGEKVKGSFALVRTSRGKDWLLIKHKDRFVSKEDITARNRSVLSAIAVDEMNAMPVQRIAAARLVPCGKLEAMPEKLQPMQAELADAPFNKPDWMWEPKLDGYRILAFLSNNKVTLRSRRGLELAATFPGVAAAIAAQGVSSMILDGELVAFDASGKPSFNALQNRFQLKTEREVAAAEKSAPVVFYRSSTCCTSPASICARRLTSTAGATSGSACCLCRRSSSFTPRKTASRSIRPRWRAASRA